MLHPSSFTIGDVTVGGGQLFLIAGPCVIESETHARSMADAIQRIASDLKMPYVFKASYDKANRTSIHSFRGPGLVEGCRILRAIGESQGLPVLTDVHAPEQCAQVSEALGAADVMLQIPAFLCRQTDLLMAAAKTGRAINVKKGQFVAPWDMRHAVEKIRESSGGGAGFADGARGEFRVQQPGGGYARAAGDAGLCAGGVRWDALGADAERGEWCEWWAAGVHSGVGAGGRGCGCGRDLSGGA
jgi:3-deoxy-D-manno-octulosonic acid (KDO) 8-phosphate synthase